MSTEHTEQEETGRLKVKDSYDERELILSLGSTVCPFDGRKKARSHSHCSRCYYRLPPSHRPKLYRRVGDGYEEAFAISMRMLADLEEEERNPESEL